ncbi:MAG: exosome complex protein Rrp42 [Candidatus Pacearchaeota archaeon]
MSDFIVPKLQKEKIIEYINQGKRLDGRDLGDYREIEIERNVSVNAESSVRVKIGKTEVFAGVKLGIIEPYPDSPDEGTFMTSAELHPMASEQYDIGKPGIESVELARVIDRGIRESGFIDFKKLCIKEGEKVWQVFLDIVAINDNGNLIDVAGLASLIALGSAKMPVYNEKEEKIEHELSNEPLPLNKEAMSFNITLHKINNSILLDVDKEEEAISNCRLSIAIGEANGKLRITAMQKGKEGVITEKDMENILNLVEDKWKEIFPKVKGYVFEEND